MQLSSFELLGFKIMVIVYPTDADVVIFWDN